MKTSQNTGEKVLGIMVLIAFPVLILYGMNEWNWFEGSEHKEMRVFCERIHPDADSYVVGRCISTYEDAKKELDPKNYCYKDNATAEDYRKCLDENDY